jgi:hypothetical protein
MRDLWRAECQWDSTVHPFIFNVQITDWSDISLYWDAIYQSVHYMAFVFAVLLVCVCVCVRVRV